MSPNPVDAANLITAVLVGGVFIGLIVYFIFLFTKGEKAQREWLSEYNKRKQAFWIAMPQRQRDLHYEMKGASDMEKFMVLEARIYELEQQLRNQQDDGK
jgi:hypothetical protein